jgi:starvation-inducible outer membrane lipoprotein
MSCRQIILAGAAAVLLAACASVPLAQRQAA